MHFIFNYPGYESRTVHPEYSTNKSRNDSFQLSLYRITRYLISMYCAAGFFVSEYMLVTFSVVRFLNPCFFIFFINAVGQFDKEIRNV